MSKCEHNSAYYLTVCPDCHEAELAEALAEKDRAIAQLALVVEAAWRLTERVRNILPPIGAGIVIPVDPTGRVLEKRVEELEAVLVLAEKGV